MSPRLSIIPAGAVTDRSLEPRDLQVLCLLGRHTDKGGWCVRSQVKMAQELDCSRGSLQNSLDRLCAAGWMDRRRRDTEVEEAGKQPSRSYAYRVLLDREDFAVAATMQDGEEEPSESHAENASEEGGCQQVGTGGVPTEQHPGANACNGTPANVCNGTMNDPLERPHLERERESRAREKEVLGLVTFEQRWPTAAADDRQRTAYAWGSLSEEEREAALAGIGPHLENLKKHKRSHPSTGWKYLEQKPWTLLAARKAAASPSQTLFEPKSPTARALHTLGRMWRFSPLTVGDGRTSHLGEITPRILAMAQCPPQDEWRAYEPGSPNYAAWRDFAAEVFPGKLARMDEIEAPWEWPPKSDGTVYSGKDPPQDQPHLTAEDERILANGLP